MDIKDQLPKHQIPETDYHIPYRNTGSLLKNIAAENPDKTVLIFPGKTTEKFTSSEMEDHYLKTASWLKSLQLKKGDRIGIVFPNSPEFVFFYFAGLTLGITVVPVNPELSPEEMRYIITDSESKRVFISGSLLAKAVELQRMLGEKIPVRIIRPLPDFEPLTGDREAPDYAAGAEVSLTDKAVIIYTSGTTGNPKGVVLSHLNLLSDARAMSEWFQFSPDTRALCILPLFHNNGQIATLLAPFYARGSAVIVKGKVSLMAFWGLAEQYGVTWSSVMASILAILLSLPGKRRDNTMKGLLCGGQVLTESVQNAFESRFGVPVFEGYGLTETTSFSCINDYPADLRKSGSIGKPLPVNDMAILDENGAILPPDTEGEICIRGFNVACEYLGLEDKNRESFAGGWFHSGDFGYRDEAGYFYFKGRKDSLIIKGGENIYPAEIENVIFKHPEIDECAAIGIPDRLLGEDICVFIKRAQNSRISAKEVKKFCRHKIAGYKQPREVIFIDETGVFDDIPRGPTKKVLYRKLKQYYLEKQLRIKN